VIGLVELRRVAREIFDHALRAVDPRKALRRALNLDATLLRICDTVFDTSIHSTYVVAIGKAAPAMAVTLDDILERTITGGVVSGPDCPELHALESGRWRVFAGGHPLPNQDSLDAAQAAFDLLRRADKERALVIFLISGGGSAMIEWPCNERITLADLREAFQVASSRVPWKVRGSGDEIWKRSFAAPSNSTSVSILKTSPPSTWLR
jgi:glycerate 2-kinase